MRHGQQHGHGVLGHADGVSAGRIHHQDALARGGVEVDVVHADAGAADDAQALGLVEQFGRDLRRAAYQQRIRVADFVVDFALGLGKVDDIPRRISLQNVLRRFRLRCLRSEFSLCSQDSRCSRIFSGVLAGQPLVGSNTKD